MVTELRKGVDGFTVKGGVSAEGHERLPDLLGPLFRDAGMAQVLERALELPDATEIVVITEGYTDGLFIKQVCEAIGRPELVEGIHFKPAGSASKVVSLAVLTDAATSLPVIALLDHDEQGRAAEDRLKSFDWKPSRGLLSLRTWPEKPCRYPDHPVEIEDLLPQRAVDSLARKIGEDALDGMQRCGSITHRQLSKSWKNRAITDLPQHLSSGDAGGIEWLVHELRARAARMQDARAARSAVGQAS